MPSPLRASTPGRRCAVLVATRNRFDLLTQRCVPSIRRQSSPPALVVIVNDSSSLSSGEQREIEMLLSPIPTVVLLNDRVPGAAGAWNTGLAYMHGRHD